MPDSSADHAADDVRATLDALVASGDLIMWTETDGDVAFTCWRLDPERHPDEYRAVWACPRCGALHYSPVEPCGCAT